MVAGRWSIGNIMNRRKESVASSPFSFRLIQDVEVELNGEVFVFYAFSLTGWELGQAYPSLLAKIPKNL